MQPPLLCMLMRKNVNSDVSKDSPYNGNPGNKDSSYFYAKINRRYRCLTEINYRYYRLSLMRTLTRGLYSVH